MSVLERLQCANIISFKWNILIVTASLMVVKFLLSYVLISSSRPKDNLKSLKT